MYNKLFTKILDSSVWLQPKETRLVWITLLAAMDEHGFVALAAVGNVALRARVPLSAAAAAIGCLESPDPESSDQANEGRRIERVPGGWMVLNAEKYHALSTRVHIQEQTRERVRRYRAAKRGNAAVTVGNETLTPSDTDTDTDPEYVQACAAEAATRRRDTGGRRHDTHADAEERAEKGAAAPAVDSNVDNVDKCRQVLTQPAPDPDPAPDPEPRTQPPTPSHAGKGRSGGADAHAGRARFESFWTAYPKKKAKKDAARAFKAAKVSEPMLEQMLAALARQRRSPDWLKDGGQFIPMPATWLRGGRWEDELQVGPDTRRAIGPDYETDENDVGEDWFAECQRLHAGECNGKLGHRQRMAIDAARAGGGR